MSTTVPCMRRRAALAVCASLLSLGVQASDQVPPPPQREPLLVTNAVLHPVSAPAIAGGRMLVERGRITALAAPGQPLAVPPGTRVLDLGGAHVWPGFISAASGLGLAEVTSVAATIDLSEAGTLNPNARAVVALNADSELIPVARSNGLLAALAVPSAAAGGGIAGVSALVQLDGWTWEDMALEREVALHVALPSLRLNPALFRGAAESLLEPLRRQADSRLRDIDEAFATAKAYARAADPAAPSDLRWEAMRPYVEGRRPVMVAADERAQIRWALSLAERHGLKLVIMGGADAATLAPLLAERQVPVIVTGTNRLPLRRDDAIDSFHVLPLALSRAGVRYAISREASARGATNDRNLPYEAAAAVAHGLPRDEALRAITLYPAQILGVADRLGSLEPGKLASFFVSDGDPLETPTQVLRLFVQGREVDAGNRQLRLADKYRQRYAK